ncbi:MAG: DNA recombination protein RmuC [Clostridiales bacterium]|nr:DNA recombination protein RmuC [Clostridiales bacterium]MDD6872429.1 DNA recombination protein RmuC [Clostridiales bacterium]MDD7367871.1 DNA recombination protein RmuC [Clostridiales bacterium]MDY2871579.1 DNA recombination protein RmuC [Eubacteriales bacterium]
MNALIQTYPLPFALILALLAALIVLLAVNARLRKMQRALRGRIIESERTITAQQTQLNETVNSVLQMSVSSAQSSEARTQQLADRLEARLSGIAESNERRLDDMRRLIDEQLSGTLEKRLGQSFQQVSRQLEQVYKGLGEMQTLAGGVGDLKKVLTGVKTRGVWGEIQLGRLLGDTLTEGQYLENTPVVPGSSERVEFAVRLPGRDGAGLLLPIDSKFPLDAFRHLIDESETGDKARADKAALLLQRAVLDQAKKISEKYVKPPYTTDFALMFLPIESLYAEVMRRESLNEEARARFHVVIAGPSTLSALLNSLSLGFRTLSIEQRTGEVWQLLGTLRGEFLRFGDTLERMRQRLDQATGELDTATARSRAITRRLNELEDFSPEKDGGER